MSSLSDRILATIAEAERRLALAEAAQLRSGPGTHWEAHDEHRDIPEADRAWCVCIFYMDTYIGDSADCGHEEFARHIEANDPPTIVAEQRRIIAAGHADLALLAWLNEDGSHCSYGTGALTGWALEVYNSMLARYPEVEA